MPRVHVKKGTRFTEIDEGAMEAAIKEVIEKTLSIRKAANKYGLKPSTLESRLAKFRAAQKEDHIPARAFRSKFASFQVFTEEEENLLNKYITDCSKMHYGMTLIQVRKLAFEFAKANELRYPSSWDHNKMAGKDWLQSYRRRHPNLSLRQPENTSAARSFAFNKTAVNEFYSNLASVYVKYNLTGDRIFNFDESGISTVMQTPRVLADKKQKQIGQLVSAERGELVTFGGIISASGNTIPPLFIFPRVHFKDQFMEGAPEGSLGVATKSGWINSAIYLEVLKHIQKRTSSSKDNPILLLVDNHESHVTLEAVDYARGHGIIYVSFPPHTTHRLQPLDVGVFGPFKAKLKVAFNDWHISNPGKTLNIYNIPTLAKRAYFESFTGKNITSAFEKTGIYPFNRLVFSDEDFAPVQVYSSSVTDPDVSEQPIEDHQEQGSRTVSPSLLDPSLISGEIVASEEVPTSEPGPSSSFVTSRQYELPSTSAGKGLTPEAVRPYPKINKTTQKKTKKGKEPGKSRIYTDTPEKYRLEEIEKSKIFKKQEQDRKQKAKEIKRALTLLSDNKIMTENTKSKRKKQNPKETETQDDTIIDAIKEKPKKQRKAEEMASEDEKKTEEKKTKNDTNKENIKRNLKKSREAEETESENETIMSLRESSCSPMDEMSGGSDLETEPPVMTTNIKEGCFVLVKFEKKNSVLHYVGQVVSKYGPCEYKVSFLRKKPGTWKFVFPTTKDEGTVYLSDVVCILQQLKSAVTARTADIFCFKKNLSMYHVQ